MASISKQPNGRKTIQFYDTDSTRKSIRLGKVSLNIARAFKVKVESLLASKITQQPIERDTALWLVELDTKMKSRLARVGLIAESQSAKLKEFLDEYVKLRTDVKADTKTVYGHTIRNLVTFFGEEKRLFDITEADAIEWRLNLKEQGLADNTVRRRSGIAKQFFSHAEKKKLIESNPFLDLAAAIQENREREYFVTSQDAQAVIEAAPDAEWRMIIALSRYGGLRCPSEILKLKWSDIDYEAGKILITSPKTEHHPGKATRIIPLFPELAPYIDECFELAKEKAKYVITRYRSSKQNLRSTFEKIQKRAKLEQWPKPFHNMRASRETELCNEFPEHVVCKWLGNSPKTARKSYLQVTEEHYEKATQKSGAKSGAVGCRNQQKRGCNTVNSERKKAPKN